MKSALTLSKAIATKFGIFAIGIGLAATTQAAVLTQYTFDRSGSMIDFTADTSGAPGVTATDFTSADSNSTDQAIPIASASGSSFTSFFNSSGSPFTDAAVLWQNGGLATGTSSNLDNAIANNQFVNFTVTAPTGQFLDLTSFTFDSQRSGPNGVADFAVRSSVDGFANNLLSGQTGENVDPDSFETHTTDLSASDFDNLSSVEFRVYFDNRDGNGNGGSGTALDNFILNGEVIPEPSTLVIVSLLGGLTLLQRKRRVQS